MTLVRINNFRLKSTKINMLGKMLTYTLTVEGLENGMI